METNDIIDLLLTALVGQGMSQMARYEDDFDCLDQLVRMSENEDKIEVPANMLSTVLYLRPLVNALFYELSKEQEGRDLLINNKPAVQELFHLIQEEDCKFTASTMKIAISRRDRKEYQSPQARKELEALSECNEIFKTLDELMKLKKQQVN